jgi:hypothetical protein
MVITVTTVARRWTQFSSHNLLLSNHHPKSRLPSTSPMWAMQQSIKTSFTLTILLGKYTY